MAVYCVSYDLNKIGQRYNDLYEELKKCPGYCHPLDSTWFVSTSETVDQLFNRLRRVLDDNDHILIHTASHPSQGWLGQEMWDWITPTLPYTG